MPGKLGVNLSRIKDCVLAGLTQSTTRFPIPEVNIRRLKNQNATYVKTLIEKIGVTS